MIFSKFRVRNEFVFFTCVCLAAAITADAGETAKKPTVIESRQSGVWSDPQTWQGAQLPTAGQSVLIQQGHSVTYDVASKDVIRAVHISGRLEFRADASTRLECGLIKIQAGNDVSEAGFDCELHAVPAAEETLRPALVVGRQDSPIRGECQALIRLHHVAGMDPNSCPAIVCCAGQMDFHGNPLDRTWVKLDITANKLDDRVCLITQVLGWKVGDRIVITGTNRDHANNHQVSGSVLEDPFTEERLITAIEQVSATETHSAKTILGLDQPLQKEHYAEGRFRAEVANLSRNVIVESADPEGVRGHTMYHVNSAGSISYAEFRHLGKRDTLGRYALHFHLIGNTMRGSSVVGASIWDSHNRWLTIHGTNHLIVRDCVGYKSVGHGFFLEDGTEINNVLDGNLAIMALRGKALKNQIIPFDNNDGAGFWWANCRNAFINNVAAECDEYGFRFETKKTDSFDPVLPILQPDGTTDREDTRLITFVRFDNNEAHTQRLFGMNLRGIDRPSGPGAFGVFSDEVAQVPHDYRKIFVIRDFKVWDTRWPFHAGASGVMVDGLDVFRSTYGIWRSVMDRHGYRRMTTSEIHHSDIFMPIALPSPKLADRDDYDPAHFPGIGTRGGEDNLPPATVITRVRPEGTKLRVEGVSIDANKIKAVTVNGHAVESKQGEYANWSILVDMPADGSAVNLAASGEDILGNTEQSPHRVTWSQQDGLKNARSNEEGHASTFTR